MRKPVQAAPPKERDGPTPVSGHQDHSQGPGVHACRQITWQLLGWMMHAERSGYRLRVSASVPPSCSVQGGVLFSPYVAERGITHLALEVSGKPWHRVQSLGRELA
ncbi:hypothetical protein AB1E18_012042 [Capra hircus]